MLSPVVRDFPARVYVPNSGRHTVDVIDPQTFKIIEHFDVGREPQHVAPSYDLKTLSVLSDLGDSVSITSIAVDRQKHLDLTVGYSGRTFPLVLAQDQRSWLTA